MCPRSSASSYFFNMSDDMALSMHVSKWSKFKCWTTYGRPAISCNIIDGALSVGCSSLEPSFRNAGGEVVGVPFSLGTFNGSLLPLRVAFGEPSKWYVSWHTTSDLTGLLPLTFWIAHDWITRWRNSRQRTRLGGPVNTTLDTRKTWNNRRTQSPSCFVPGSVCQAASHCCSFVPCVLIVLAPRPDPAHVRWIVECRTITIGVNYITILTRFRSDVPQMKIRAGLIHRQLELMICHHDSFYERTQPN